ncbi:helix-turn-helix transcriptional regulator [Kitasatospora sp. NPDC059571]|uniref:helix-turn-helix transcriptional regulator n=1 Tax=Kitasatospora sp. NPDC059571 TaxID=3346871 RepID=UPI003699AE22
MTHDWPALGRAVAHARKALGMTQQDLASAVGVGRSTVQSLERGERAHPKVLHTHLAIARALGWTEGSIEQVLTGGAPTPAGASRSTHEIGAPTAAASVLDELSERVRLALIGGKVVDGDVIDLAPDDPDSVAVLILKRGERPDATPEQMREDLRKWAKLQRAAREIFSEDPQSPR